LRIVFFTFYFPPDLSAGSFRSVALSEELSKRLKKNDELHIITTHPNRYKDYRVEAKNFEVDFKITIHRITTPIHQSGIIGQVCSFSVYAFQAYKLCIKTNPDFIIGTTSRLMTGILSGVSAHKLKCKYFIDLRDIFSEAISDLLSLKSKLLGKISKLIFTKIERKLFNNASGVNVVSEGFFEYFSGINVDTSNWSFFPNGVDIDFINHSFKMNDYPNNVKKIVYAGNFGIGQGLDLILPKVAKRLGNKYHFLVIGAGSNSQKLVNAIKSENIKNIKILLPVKREKLIEYYINADILFLHLKNIPAYKRVLPSKLFEYTVMKKPIVAGTSGYSAKFIKNNIPHAKIFSPSDVDGCMNAIKEAENLDIKSKYINTFIQEYSREKIMNRMAKHILSIL
jgi:hypothetical protein